MKSKEYLKEYLESVERRGARPGDGAGHAAGHQVAPPRAAADLLIGEVVGHADVLAEVEHLQDKRVQAPSARPVGKPDCRHAPLPETANVKLKQYLNHIAT